MLEHIRQAEDAARAAATEEDKKHYEEVEEKLLSYFE